MEIETEKRKIEFWAEGTDVAGVLLNNRTDEMMAAPVEVSLKIAYTTRKNKKGGFRGQRMTEFASILEYYLPLLRFIDSRSQIVSLTIEKTVSDIPGISFFMQEVE
jgi:hypothetical protein